MACKKLLLWGVFLTFLISQIFSQNSFVKEKHFEGVLKNGKPDSTWLYFYPDGEIAIVAHFKDGLRDSLWQYYNTSGRITTQIAYKNNQKHGTFQSYFDNGNAQWIKNYNQDQVVGFANSFFENGQVHIQTGFANSEFHGFYREYYNNGTLKMEGKYENGKLMQVNFINSFEGEKLKEYPIQNGTGTLFEFWENGNIRKRIQYKNGEKNGLFESFDSFGKPLERGNYINNIKSGRWTYFENGKRRRINYSKTAQPLSEFLTPDAPASFPGDISALHIFLEPYKSQLSKQSYFIKLVIDDFGKIENYEIRNNPKQEDVEILKKLMQDMPLWIPARRRGEPIKSIYILNFTAK